MTHREGRRVQRGSELGAAGESEEEAGNTLSAFHVGCVKQHEIARNSMWDESWPPHSEAWFCGTMGPLRRHRLVVHVSDKTSIRANLISATLRVFVSVTLQQSYQAGRSYIPAPRCASQTKSTTHIKCTCLSSRALNANPTMFLNFVTTSPLWDYSFIISYFFFPIKKTKGMSVTNCRNGVSRRTIS